MEDKVKKYLMNKLNYVYCNTCDAECCEYCNRKSMCWGMSEYYAKYLADKIINIINGVDNEE